MKGVWGRIPPNLTICVQFSLTVGFSVWFFLVVHVDLMCGNEKAIWKTFSMDRTVVPLHMR